MAEEITKKKETLNVTISPYLKRKVEEFSQTKDFSSASDLTSLALAEFFMKYELERENVDILELLVLLSENEKCRLEMDRILSMEKEKLVKHKHSKHPTKIVEDLTIEDEGAEL